MNFSKFMVLRLEMEMGILFIKMQAKSCLLLMLFPSGNTYMILANNNIKKRNQQQQKQNNILPDYYHFVVVDSTIHMLSTPIGHFNLVNGS